MKVGRFLLTEYYIVEGNIINPLKLLTQIYNCEIVKLKNYERSLILSIISKFTVSPGSDWDKNTTKLQSAISENNLTEVFKKIKGRTRTRFGYHFGSFLQGPHTVARHFGYEFRKQGFIGQNSPKKVSIREAKSYFSYLFTLFNKVKNWSLYFNFTSESKHYHEDFQNFNYVAHINYLIDSFNQCKTISEVIVCGQLLSDLHPFATSFNLIPSRDEIAGKGEGSSTDNLIKECDFDETGINCDLIFKLIDTGGFGEFEDFFVDEKQIEDKEYDLIVASFLIFIVESVMCHFKAKGYTHFENRKNIKKLIKYSMEKYDLSDNKVNKLLEEHFAL